MIIILDGPDGSGKTTAIGKLKEQYPEALVHHFGAPVPEEDQFLRYAYPMIDNPDKMLIYDRSWLSEFVYGPIMRGKSELNVTHCRLLEALVKDHGGGHIIYLTAPTRTLWSRCKQRGETYIESREQLNEISMRYESMMKELPTLPVFRVDTSR